MGARPCSSPTRCASATWTRPSTKRLLRGRRRGHRALRQLRRRAHRRRRRLFRPLATRATRWSTPSASAPCATTRSGAARPRASATRSTTSARPPGATAWAAPSFASQGAERRERGGPAGRAEGRPVHGEAPDRGLPRDDGGARARRRHPGHGRGGPHLLDLRDREPRAAPASRSSSTGCPQRETGMNSYEIMLSESQERMLVIVQQGREREIEAIFAKWDLHAAHVGARDRHGPHGRPPPRRRGGRHPGPVAHRRGARSTTARRARPAYLAATRAGRRRRRARRPRRGRRASRAPQAPCASHHRLEALDLPPVRPHGAARHGRPARAAMPASCGCGSARARSSSRSATTATAGTATSTRAAGRMIAMVECLRNLACAGRHAAGDDGQPQLRQSLQAGEFLPAARVRARAWPRPAASSTCPVVGGNVSLYNESPEGAIDPTPTVAVVGLIEDERARHPPVRPGSGREARPARRRARRAGRQPVPRRDPRPEDRRRPGRGPGGGEEAAGLPARRRSGRAALRAAHDLSEGGLLVRRGRDALRPGRDLRGGRRRWTWPRLRRHAGNRGSTRCSSARARDGSSWR